MIKFACIVLLGLVSACAQIDAGRAFVKTEGAAAADRVAEDATWFVCNAITVGAARRTFGSSADKADAYRRLCATTIDPSVDVVVGPGA